jgi:hypothetical protein
MRAPIQIRSSLVAGNVPVSLKVGELGINEADSLLFYRNPTGVVTSFNLAGGGGGGGAPINSPVFTGDPKAPTPTAGDNDTSIATTAFVTTAITGKADTTAVTASLALKADLASPTFTGDPKAPTPSTGDNDTSIATTAFVKAQSYLTSADLSAYAPLASPALSGNPTAPTPTAGDNDTSIATTAFVTGALTAKADLASPTFTGDPKAPTPAAGDNDTSIATTAFAQSAIATSVTPQAGLLTMVSASQIKFAPYGGDRIKINGVLYSIPAAGITGGTVGVYVNGVATQTLVPATVYFVYLFNNVGTLTIDYSTTARATSTTAGNVGTQIKSGDDSRSLIGMVRIGGTSGAPTFYNDRTWRAVRSWFNRQAEIVDLGNNFTAQRSMNMQSPAEVNSEIRLSYLTWTAETVAINFIGSVSVDTANKIGYVSIAIDGSVNPIGVTYPYSVVLPGVGGAWYTISPSIITQGNSADGFHYATVMAWNEVGSIMYFGLAGAGIFCSLNGAILH